ncbi:MAG: hypothetical protein IJJ85_07370 [Clostridia bacterium]|nr:hypothetical protein [Clostridia bacterium]
MAINMAILTVDPERACGRIKPMHCVNNGPVKAREDQVRGNFETYKALQIPYARNHDASFFAGYGGPHCVDINAVFPCFDRDENDPAAYDFHLTDEYILNTLSAGTKTFYRLGSRIEHETKKYGTLPPPDFEKWARVCEHIIRHYTEGWADGLRLDLEYWEIWNEADGAEDDDDPYWKKCWGGTKAQFFELFRITAAHLKRCFPHLKIGGPAVCCNSTPWTYDFLDYCAENRVPLDFFSWHAYAVTPENTLRGAKELRQKLDALGYKNTESICNEWNYVRNWDTEFIDSILTINGLKGAAYTAATILYGQRLPIDMLMYYDFRPCPFCGPYNYYTLRPQKPYYPFLMYSELYRKGTEIETRCDDEAVYTVGAKDATGVSVMGAYYGDGAGLPAKTLTVKGLKDGAELYLLDEDRDMEKAPMIVKDGEAALTLQPYTVFLIRS